MRIYKTARHEISPKYFIRGYFFKVDRIGNAFYAVYKCADRKFKVRINPKVS